MEDSTPYGRTATVNDVLSQTHYTRDWGLKCAQQFFQLHPEEIRQLAGAPGRNLLMALWETLPPAQFYEHPFAIVRQEWWHAYGIAYHHSGFWAALPNGARVLDFGCGVAALAQPWIVAQRGMTHLFETSTACLQYLHYKYQHFLGGNLRLDNVAALEDVRPASYDALLCTDVLEHVENPLALQEALWALLKPGGYALLKMEPAYPHPGHLHEAVIQYPAWIAWARAHTEVIEEETYAWVRKPE